MTARQLFTLPEAKQALSDRGYNLDGYKDAAMVTVIDAITPVIEDIVGTVVEAELTETHPGGRPAILLAQRPTAIVSVTAGGTALASPAGYTANLRAATLRAVAGVFPADEDVVVVYTAGYPDDEIPPNIKLAAIELFRFAWQTTRQGTRPMPLRGGSTAIDVVATQSGYLVPNLVMAWLKPNPSLPGFA